MINLTISDEVVNAPPRNKYKLVVEYMHGDADADTEVVKFFDSPESISAVLYGLTLMRDLAFPEVSRPAAQKAALKKFFGSDRAAFDRFVDEFWPYDLTDQSFDYHAALQGFEITYFDDVGDEYEVHYDIEIYETLEETLQGEQT